MQFSPSLNALESLLCLTWKDQWKLGKFSTAVVSYSLLLIFVGLAQSVKAQAQDPEFPSQTSTLGETVKAANEDKTANVNNSTVNELQKDQANTSQNIFVQTSNTATPTDPAYNWWYFVTPSGEEFEQEGNVFGVSGDPINFNLFDQKATLTVTYEDCKGDCTNVKEIDRISTPLEYSLIFADVPGGPPIDPNISGNGGAASGIYYVSIGKGGSNGGAGFIIGPGNGGNGEQPSDLVWVNNSDADLGFYTGDVTIGIDTLSVGIETGSVGGPGGKGGNSNLSFSGGGNGGAGGDGGVIDFTNESTIVVRSKVGDPQNNFQNGLAGYGGGIGIAAYSIGGSGGDGGDGNLAPVGGSGNTGGAGGDVSVTNLGNVQTSGSSIQSSGQLNSFGIYAFSGGGAGGGGGNQFGLWGWSGDGGSTTNGGNVTITNGSENDASIVQTNGVQSHVLYAQSVGGRGGNAGTNANLFYSGDASGGTGGDSGDLVVDNYGTLTSFGIQSRGIHAQSVGGGGGSGSSSAGLISIAGQGGIGGSAGTVKVNNWGSITTKEYESDGLFAQSVGGSGGSAGNSVGLVSLGGDGATAGNGANVTVKNFGSISTSENLNPILNSTTAVGGRGIFAQSVGGAGGDAGFSVGQISIGGSGGGGGAGGEVNVINQGNINTYGTNASGIYSQSVGGGGGNGGSATAVGAFVSVGIGGSGGVGGAGGNVKVNLEGVNDQSVSTIATEGSNSYGLFAQSVGGGGGNGGGAFSLAGGVGVSVSVAVGGSGGAAGDGGLVNLDKTQGGSSITTSGDFSTGAFLQSIGGGGGSGGYATSGSLAAGPAAVAVAVGDGGDGGSGGDGGLVIVGDQSALPAGYESDPVNNVAFDVNNLGEGYSGSISTQGKFSPGFIAQSVGGGGGNGGTSTAVSATASPTVSASIGVSLGGGGGKGGVGGSVGVGLGAINISTQDEYSPALLVQSVGGGGGNGGSSINVGLSAGGAAAGAVTVGMGGPGGAGNEGGNVYLATSGGNILTNATTSTAITAQSIGGGGGNGGSSVTVNMSGGAAAAGGVNVGLGGDGSGGGKSGKVTTAINQESITTLNTESSGVLVQSVGGGGGNGGYSVTVTGAGAGAAAGTIGVSLGGQAAGGGSGGEIDASINSDVTTKGANSSAVIAQSLGGGGGNGGFSVGVGIAGAGTASGAINVGIGGAGGEGGTGDLVKLDYEGKVETEGTKSSGVLAQSVGGGGGSGGFNVNVGAAGAGVASGAINVGLGGKGAGGGGGGAIDADIDGDVTTKGNSSKGVVAQSVGGGGGSGGFNVNVGVAGAGTVAGAVNVGLGGSGGQGGAGDLVKLNYEGEINTEGNDSAGVFAQSLGGGGGDGGFNVNVGASGAGTVSGTVGVSLGGEGAGGSSGGEIDATVKGDVNTQGKNSTGVIAQSIGGGGGDGGFSVNVGATGAGTVAGAINVGLGGNGGKGGEGGEVKLNYDGSIDANGDESSGVFAQSLGGGGGNGGFNINVGGSGSGTVAGTVNVGLGGSADEGGTSKKVEAYINKNNQGSGSKIITLGDNSSGIVAQSLGGGGGNGGFNVNVGGSGSGTASGAIVIGLGGKGGGGASSGKVILEAYSDVTTDGSQSSGVIAQSLGGGGGNGGFNVNVGASGAGTASGDVSVGLGGKGTAGGDSDTVDVKSTGNITTKKNYSKGLFAQSLGGGGGNGAFNVNVGGSGAGTGSGSVSVGLGGTGGAAGNAETVTAESGGEITTDGESSSAFVAQSIGGGGGSGGFNVNISGSGAGTGSGALSVGLGGQGDGGGKGGEVIAKTSADIETSGDYSLGILAQSVGGGGGDGGFNVSAALSGAGTGSGALSIGLGGSGAGGGDASGVTLDVDNDVKTGGLKSTAILAQSVGGGGGNGAFNVSFTGSGAGNGSGSASIGVGGSGGGGGDSGNVQSIVIGNLLTTAVDSDATPSDADLNQGSAGLIAQSVGGGGGNGGFNVSGGVSVGISSGSGTVSVGVGGSGGDGGDALKVTNSLTGDVFTSTSNGVGVLAQSVGGGGGNGGFNVSGGISASQSGSGNLGVGVGGFGGKGGNSGSISNTFDPNVIAVDNTVVGNVSTTGADDAAAIVAQSLGGGGGNGGFNVTGTLTISTGSGAGSVGVGVGGSGGDGGFSSKVLNVVDGSVSTQGKNSNAITAVSQGGGGGNGGFNVTGGLNVTNSGTGNLGVGVGGLGGKGGDAGGVINNVNNLSGPQNISTEGKSSYGVLVQSLAGGGGNGGFNVTGIAQMSLDSSSGSLGVGVGGFGGDGGDSGLVENNVNGVVTTNSDSSIGVAALSQAGGGGNGGFNVIGSLSASKGKTGSLGVGIGGFGGKGGNSGSYDNIFNAELLAVNNYFEGTVSTQGSDSHGMLAQSLGGGGGNGGFNINGAFNVSKGDSGNLGVGIGGFGSDGGFASKVFSQAKGDITTTGDSSMGFAAISQGGGGGTGGMNVTAGIVLSKEKSGNLGFGLGGFGGGGGDAGNVNAEVLQLNASDKVMTQGNSSRGILAQSLGGGGGNGGFNVTGGMNLSGKSGAGIGIGIGGFGGSGGDSSNVDLLVNTNVETTGNNSDAVAAISQGGGGGNGGFNIAGGLSLSVEANDSSSKNFGASIGVGGFGGDGGNSGAVELDFSGLIKTTSTSGSGSNGLVAQSIAGGGGNGGFNISGGVNYAKGDDSKSYGLAFGLGGFGGGAGNSGDVTTKVGKTTTSRISTQGDKRSAVLAQSIGGSGGNGGFNITGGVSGNSSLLVGVGGSGGEGGTAGSVDVDVTAELSADNSRSKSEKIDESDNPDYDPTRNAGSLLAQSIGGGGGNGGLNITGGFLVEKGDGAPSVTVGIGGTGGAGNNSDDVTVKQTGVVTSKGDLTHGVMAQSVGGGGGAGGLNVSQQISFSDSDNSGGKTDATIVVGVGGNAGDGGKSGSVQVTQLGVVSTDGDAAKGVVAQSIAGGGGQGAINYSGIIAKASNPIVVGVGGSGGSGNTAGSASVIRGTASQEAGLVTTDGKGASAIEASSIGGGGGNAGMNFTLAISLAGEDKSNEKGYRAQINVGGSGGSGNDAGAASVNNNSNLVTKQDNSHGVVSQSLGGGGGSGTYNLGIGYQKQSKDKDKNKKVMGLQLSVGGSTGSGGIGSSSTVINKGDVSTNGKESYGILSQSIGGGGGNAGFDMFSNESSLASKCGDACGGDAGNITLKVGQVGGEGGSSGNTSVSSNGAVTTTGSKSYGLFAQSVGGGGGNSSSTSLSIDIPEDEGDQDSSPKSLAVSVGLEGAAGGDSGELVTITSTGTVQTSGENAHAIFAQGIGGGGGNAGSSSTKGSTAPTIAVTLGSEGGGGGQGAEIRIQSESSINTTGKQSLGIFAQSIGGGGGTGTVSDSGTFTNAATDTSLSLTIGGAGGSGNESKLVDVKNAGNIFTDGEDSHAILAQSIGGGGGTGGYAKSSIGTKVANDKEASKATSVQVAIGGSGGTAAKSGDVNVVNSAGIATQQENSIGIFAQSISGGGGEAGATEIKSSSGTESTSLSLAIGGDGGSGSTAGNVEVKNESDGIIITSGDRSHGILAMSVGGGGGNASTVSSSTSQQKKDKKKVKPSNVKSYSVAIGGTGGDGGVAGTVEVENAGIIETNGNDAHGLIAQSVGGKGGNAFVKISGDTSLTNDDKSKGGKFSLGGSGGEGGKGNFVKVTNSGSITTAGDNSYGVYAQSVGGGGGDGGFKAKLSKDLASKKALAQSFSNITLGGSAGKGGDAGDVTVNHEGSITINGDNTYGIFAQSVGGGGGNFKYAASSPAWAAADAVINTVLGGSDDNNGQAGQVIVNSSGVFNVNGANSKAKFTQMVNDGGGNVNTFSDVSEQAQTLNPDGTNLPPGTPTEVDNTPSFIKSGITLGTDAAKKDLTASAKKFVDKHFGDLKAKGKNAIASLKQSISGGGGSATHEIKTDDLGIVDAQARLGALQSENLSSSDVEVTRVGDIAVAGENAFGSLSQTIAGGGGHLVVTKTTTGDGISKTISTNEVVLGSSDTQNSNSGKSTHVLTGNLTTKDDSSPGLVIQSIGAGGGTSNASGFDQLLVTLGADNSSQGNAGDIVLRNQGSVNTEGDNSSGIVIQTVGGGGGLQLTDLDSKNVNVALNNSNTGNGGSVELSQVGDIIVLGEGSMGIAVQSLGGGGGMVNNFFKGSAGGQGSSDKVSIRYEGNLEARNKDAVGIYAQSAASGSQGDIDIEIASKSIVSAGPEGVGIQLAGGTNNLITNYGSIFAAQRNSPYRAPYGTTILGGLANETVVNESGGLVFGNVDLGGGINTFDNKLGAVVLAGDTLFIGDTSDSLFINEGTLAAANDPLRSIDLFGSYVSTSGSDFDVELSFDNDVISRLLVSGFGSLDGDVILSTVESAMIQPGYRELPFILTGEGLLEANLNLDVAPSAVARYDIVYDSLNAYLGLDVNFEGFGSKLNSNQRSIGDYLNRIQSSSPDNNLASFVESIFALPDSVELREAYNSVSPEPYTSSITNVKFASRAFINDMFSCNQADGPHKFISEGECVWANTRYDFFTSASNFENFGFDSSTYTVSLGAQWEIGDDWFFGLAAGRNNNFTQYKTTANPARSISASLEGISWEGGLAIKKLFGRSKVALGMAYGNASYDVIRRNVFPEFKTAESTQNIGYFASTLSLSTDIDLSSDSYLRPMLDLGYTNIDQKGFNETGAGSMNLEIQSGNNYYFVLRKKIAHN